MTYRHAPAVTLVLLEHNEGVLRPPSLEALTAARALGPVQAISVGEGIEQWADIAGAYGASTLCQLHVAESELAAGLAHGIAELALNEGATTVVLSSSLINKEVAALVAHRLDAGLIIDAVGFEVGLDNRLTATKHAFGSTWTVAVEVTRPRAVIVLKPNAVVAEPIPSPLVPDVQEYTPRAAEGVVGLRLLERTRRPASSRPPLAEAQVVVVGGRGTGGDFGPLELLAEALGGSIGSTRVATDEGWIAQETRIGQTGVTVAPRVYIGAGVSGAVHHRGGMQAAGAVLAINNDPDAPIFDIADFGVVGDLFTVLPQLTSEVLRLRS